MVRRRRLFWSGLDLLDMVDQCLRASNPKLTLCQALTAPIHPAHMCVCALRSTFAQKEQQPCTLYNVHTRHFGMVWIGVL